MIHLQEMSVLQVSCIKESICLRVNWLQFYFRDIQKATQNFTTIIGQGSFGPVYKATMPAGDVVAVKVLASNSKQGEKEFQTEVKPSN